MRYLIVHSGTIGAGPDGSPYTIRRGVYQVLPQSSLTPAGHVAVQDGDVWAVAATGDDRVELADQLLTAQRITSRWNVSGGPGGAFQVGCKLLGRLDKTTVAARMHHAGHRVGRWVADAGRLAGAPVLVASLTNTATS